jgi:hypothetical protein
MDGGLLFTMLDRTHLADLIGKQHGVIGRSQAIECGMTDQALRYRLRPDGPWQRLLPGVYIAQGGTATADQRDMAALLHAGPGSVITGFAAMRRLGLSVPRTGDTDVVDVLVPAARRRQDAGFARVLRTIRMPGQYCISGEIRFVMAARAVADAARGLKISQEVRAVVADAVQRDWCTSTELAEELRNGPMRGSARLRQVLAEVALRPYDGHIPSAPRVNQVKARRERGTIGAKEPAATPVRISALEDDDSDIPRED